MRKLPEDKLTQICIGACWAISILILTAWIVLSIVPDTILSSFVVRMAIELGDVQRIAGAGTDLLIYEINHIIQSGKSVLLILSVAVLIWTMLWKYIFNRSNHYQQQPSLMVTKENDELSITLLVFILIIAVIIRLINFNQSFWLDELVSVYHYFGQTSFYNIFIARTFNNHIFYSIWAHISGYILGGAEWTYRLPSLLFGLGGIWAMTKFAAHFGNRRIIFVSTVLLAISPLHIDQSQQARGYTLLVLCVIVSSHILLRLLKENNKNLLLWYIVITIIGMWTHLYMAMIVISQLFIVLFGTFFIKQEKSRLVDIKTANRFFLATTLIGITTVLLYAPSLPYIIFSVFRDAIPVSTINTSFILQVIKTLGSGEHSKLWSLFSLLLFFIGIIWLWYKQKILSLYATFTFIVPISLISALQPVFLYPRFFIFLLPLYLIVVASGIEAIVTKIPIRQKSILSALITCVLIGVSIPTTYLILTWERQNYREAAQFINQYNAEDTIIIVPGYAEKEIAYYTPGFQIIELKSVNEIKVLAEKYNKILFFVTLNYNLDNDIINFIKVHGEKLVQYYSKYGYVIVYEYRKE